MDTEPLRIVGYVRISTEGQVDNSSTDYQKQAISSFCTGHGHTLLGIFEDVASGTDWRRPGLRRALQAVKRADALAVLRVDRLGRTVLGVLDIVQNKLTPFSKRLLVLETMFDTRTPTGVYFLTNLAAMAELERNLIHERTQAGKAAKAAAGLYAGGAPAFGWVAQKGSLVASQAEGHLVRFIAGLRKRGASLRDIARRLEVAGFPTKRGGKWHPSIISKILRRLKLR